MTKAKSNLAEVLADFVNDVNEGKLLDSYEDKLCVPEFEAYEQVLSELIENATEYENELKKSLVSVHRLRMTINEAERQRRKARVLFQIERKPNDAISLLKGEAENICKARSDMEASEADEKRKVSFRLVEIYVGWFVGLLIAYVTYLGIYHQTPIDQSFVLGFTLLFILGCALIYVAIGALARVKIENAKSDSQERASA